MKTNIYLIQFAENIAYSEGTYSAVCDGKTEHEAELKAWNEFCPTKRERRNWYVIRKELVYKDVILNED